eukprot:TRINITY_DN4249_c0_g1_i1.p1 TRINITY_DN4249_c0_g1~~TRINITY_DN4249_c0_g1_i1.p1  ORF type:complete len:772 (-),score=226.59 TRINITY_DN4249_c0_g1_i1:118-2433(-)
MKRFGQLALVNKGRSITIPSKVLEQKDFGVFKVFVDQSKIAWLVMDRPGKSENAIGSDFQGSVDQATAYIRGQHSKGAVKAAVLTSAKKRFCVGADVTEFYMLTEKDRPELTKRLENGRNSMKQLTSLPCPTIAAINGDALGGGLEIALACDYRVAAEGKYNLGLPEVMLGVIPGLGGTVRLPKLIGLQAGLQHVLQAKNVKPEKAKKLKLVNEVVGAGDRYEGENRFMNGVRGYVFKVMEKPKPKSKKPNWMDWALGSTPVGRKVVTDQTVKQLNKATRGKYPAPYKAFESIMNAVLEKKEDKALAFESACFEEMCVSAQSKSMMSLFFLQERCKKMESQAAHFDASDAVPCKKFAVLGAGVMGSGIAHWASKNKIECYLKDISDSAVDAGMKFVKSEFDAALKKKKMDAQSHKAALARVTAGTSNEGLKDCKVIIEAAVEVMDIKKKMVTELENEGYFNKDTIFATNTSALSIDELAEHSKFPENVVGMHFFNPVGRMPLLEVVKGKKTSRAAAATVYKLALDMGKFPIVVQDGPGFLVNRVLGIYMSEAGRMLNEGADPAKVDKAILDFGMPMGPYRLLDEVGIDVAAHVGPTLRDGLGDRFAANERMEELIKAGYLGKKTNKGFYKYNEKGKETEIDMDMLKSRGIVNPSDSFADVDVVDRCILCMINEASLILTEKIAETPEDVDLGMVFGTGFAPFRGGLCSYADNRGIGNIVEALKTLASKYGPRFEPSPMLVEMAKKGQLFFPDRPLVPLKEGKAPTPKVKWF